MNKKSLAWGVAALAVLLAIAVVLFSGLGNPDAPSPLGASEAVSPSPADAPVAAIEAATGEVSGEATIELPGGQRTAVEQAGAPKVRLDARLVHADGAPAAGAKVEFVVARRRGAPEGVFFDFAGGFGPFAGGKPTQTVVTDDAGRLELFVDAGAEGHLRMAEDSGLLFAEVRNDRVTIPGYQRDRDLGELPVDHAARLAGTVRGPGGAPIVGAKLTLRRSQGMPFGQRETEADGVGRFAFAGLRAADYRLRATALGSVPGEMGVTLAAGEERADLAVELRDGQSIAGAVVDDAGAPIVGAKVACKRKREYGPGMSWDQVDDDEAVETDGLGRFTIGGLDGAVASLQVWAAGHERVTRDEVPVGTQNLLIAVARRASIAGVLVDTGGLPLAGSRVRTRKAGDRRANVSLAIAFEGGWSRMPFAGGGGGPRTAEDGSFTLSDVEPGEFVVVADGKNHLEAESGPLQLRPGQVVEGLRIVAEPGASLEVHVVDASGRPVAKAQVTVHAEGKKSGFGDMAIHIAGAAADAPRMFFSAPQLGRGETGEDGVALICGLPVGAVGVSATHADFVQAEPVTASLAKNQTSTARVLVAPAGFVALRVTDPGGAPLAEARYQVKGPISLPDGEQKTERGKTDGEGQARVGPLAAGRYAAFVQLPSPPVDFGHGSIVLGGFGGGDVLDDTRVEFVVQGGATTDVVLVQPVLTTLSGVVTDARGPVANAKVQLGEVGATGTPAFGRRPSTRTDADGRYRIEGLPARDFVLEWGRDGAAVMHRDAIAIPAGQVQLERDLVLTAGAVRVRVQSAGGEPIERARVKIARQGAEPAGARFGWALAQDGAEEAAQAFGAKTVRTDEDGIAEIADVPPGEYGVSIDDKDHVARTVPDVLVRDGGVTDLGVVELARAGILAGEVVNLPEGPMRAAQIEVDPVDPDGEPRVHTTMQGAFAVRGLAPGSYRVRARAGFGRGDAAWGPAQEVRVEAGKRASVELSAR